MNNVTTLERLTFDDMLLAVFFALGKYTDKKDRKKRLLSIAKRCTNGGRAFIQQDLLNSTNLEKAATDACDRYLTMCRITKDFVSNGASGAIVYHNEVYPVYVNPDCKDAQTWGLQNEEYMLALVAHEFCLKYDIPKNAMGIVSLFQTSGYTGHERHVVFNEVKSNIRSI